MQLVVRDRAGAIQTSGPRHLLRVIETIPVLTSPGGLVSIPISQGNITFRWQPMRLPFLFTYTVEIYRLDFGLQTLVARVPQIPSTADSVRLVNNFLPGDHFWVLYIVDEYGNSSRSRESAFLITQ